MLYLEMLHTKLPSETSFYFVYLLSYSPIHTAMLLLLRLNLSRKRLKRDDDDRLGGGGGGVGRGTLFLSILFLLPRVFCCVLGM